jgi:hypothetical protein
MIDKTFKVLSKVNGIYIISFIIAQIVGFITCTWWFILLGCLGMILLKIIQISLFGLTEKDKKIFTKLGVYIEELED